MSKLIEMILSRGRALWSSLCRNAPREPPERNSVMTQNAGRLLHAPTSYIEKNVDGVRRLIKARVATLYHDKGWSFIS
jgi:hypothetical protein